MLAIMLAQTPKVWPHCSPPPTVSLFRGHRFEPVGERGLGPHRAGMGADTSLEFLPPPLCKPSCLYQRGGGARGCHMACTKGVISQGRKTVRCVIFFTILVLLSFFCPSAVVLIFFVEKKRLLLKINRAQTRCIYHGTFLQRSQGSYCVEPCVQIRWSMKLFKLKKYLDFGDLELLIGGLCGPHFVAYFCNLPYDRIFPRFSALCQLFTHFRQNLHPPQVFSRLCKIMRSQFYAKMRGYRKSYLSTYRSSTRTRFFFRPTKKGPSKFPLLIPQCIQRKTRAVRIPKDGCLRGIRANPPPCGSFTGPTSRGRASLRPLGMSRNSAAVFGYSGKQVFQESVFLTDILVCVCSDFCRKFCTHKHYFTS